MHVPSPSFRSAFLVWAIALTVSGLLMTDSVLAQPPGGPQPSEGGRRGFGDRGGPPSFGGSRGFGGPSRGGDLLRQSQQEAVQVELKITDAQKQKLTELSEKSREGGREAMGAVMSKMRSAETDEQRDKIREEMQQVMEKQRAATEAELKKILTPQQVQRLEQLALHSQGVMALADEKVAGNLGLAKPQQDQVQALMEEYGNKRSEIWEKLRSRELEREQADEQNEALKKEYETKIAAVLNPQQAEAWGKKLGPPPQVTAETSEAAKAGSAAQPAATPMAPVASQPTVTTPVVGAPMPGATPPAAPATPAAVDAGPAPEVVASFDAAQSSAEKDKADQTAKTIDAKSEKPEKPVAKRPDVKLDPSARRLSFNFRYAPWSDVLQMFAEVAGLTLDLSDVPPGTFNYFDARQYTPTEALDVLNGYLLRRGYLMVHRDEFLVVVNIDQGIPPNLVPFVRPDDLAARGRNELMTVVFPLEGITPDEAATEVQQLIGPQGKVVPLAKSNRLVVTDIGTNLRRIHELLQASSGSSGSSSVAVIELSYLDPVAVAGTLKSLFAADGNSMPAIEADLYGQRLMVRGTPDQVVQVKSILAQLGEDGTSDDPQSVNRGPVRRIRLGGRDPQQMLKLIEKAWGDAGRNPIRVIIPAAQPFEGEQKLPAEEPSVRPPASREEQAPPPRSQPEAGDRDTRTEVDVPAQRRTPVFVTSQVRQISEQTEKTPAAPAEQKPVAPAPAAKPAAEQPAVEKPAAEQPAVEKPAAEKPAVEKPAAEKPAVETKPAAPKPAAQAPAQPAPVESKPVEKAPIEKAPVGDPAPQKPAAKPQPAPQNSPITITFSGDELIIASDDPQALDQMELLVESLAQAVKPQTNWTIFYLSSADANEAATMLGKLFPSSSVTASTIGNTGTLGNLSSGLSSVGRGLMDFTGLSSLGATADQLLIIPEVRSNALFVTGPPDLVRQVEDVLKILDASELPQQLRDRIPKMIPVEYADVDEVAQIVRDVYSVELNPPRSQNNDRGGNPFAMLMGRGRDGGDSRTEQVKMTLGVDKNTNSLVISASDALYRQVESLVKEVDQAAYEAKRTVRVIHLENTNSQIVQQALGSLLPKVKISTTATSSRSSSSTPQPGTPGQSDSRSGSGPSSDQMRQFFEQRMRERMQQGGGFGPPGGFGSRSGGDSRSGSSDRSRRSSGDSSRGRDRRR